MHRITLNPKIPGQKWSDEAGTSHRLIIRCLHCIILIHSLSVTLSFW